MASGACSCYKILKYSGNNFLCLYLVEPYNTRLFIFTNYFWIVFMFITSSVAKAKVQSSLHIDVWLYSIYPQNMIVIIKTLKSNFINQDKQPDFHFRYDVHIFVIEKKNQIICFIQNNASTSGLVIVVFDVKRHYNENSRISFSDTCIRISYR